MNHTILRRSISCAALCLFSCSYAFNPFEALQQLQKQAILAQRAKQAQQATQQQQQQKLQQAQTAQQKAQQTPANSTPEKPIIEEIKETFKPFDGYTPTQAKGCFAYTDPTITQPLPNIRVSFQGMEVTSDAEGFFTLPIDDNNLHKYSLIIAKNIKHAFEKNNTLKHLQIDPHAKFEYYTFRQDPEQEGVWIPYKKRTYKKYPIVPHHSIIVFLDPKYIDHVESWNINLSNNIVKLPHIYLKSRLASKKIQRAAAKSLLKSLDQASYHQAIHEHNKKPTQKINMRLFQG